MSLCSTVHVVEAGAVAPQPWRNGGGTTRELLTWPPGADWQLRISRADITADGPFSAFPGVQRWFTVLRGAGVALDFAGREHLQRDGDAPLHFDGADAPGCRLLDGSTQDLNLMLRSGRGGMWPVAPGQVWSDRFTVRALYTAAAGTWSSGDESRALEADSLLWTSDAETSTAAWTFTPLHAGGDAWWMGFTPEAR